MPENFHRPEIPLEKTREIDNEARISKKAEMKRKFNRNQKRITLWDMQLSSLTSIKKYFWVVLRKKNKKQTNYILIWPSVYRAISLITAKRVMSLKALRKMCQITSFPLTCIFPYTVLTREYTGQRPVFWHIFCRDISF